MAYQTKRRSYKRKAYSRKGQWYNKKYSVGDMASAALKGVVALKGIINSEKKFVNYTASGTNITSVGSVIPMTNIPQGDQADNRQGNSIFARTMAWNAKIIWNASASPTLVRVLIFEDLQQISDTIPSVSDIFDTVSPLSGLNRNNLGRFKVLHDQKVQLDANRRQNLSMKYLNFQHHVRYNGTAAVDIQKGGIYFLYLSDQTAFPPTIDYNVRLGYYDN